jgi:UDP-glucose-4-epimerase GalE
MRVLVTGGAGYIGSHTVAWLRSAGHEVVVLDTLEHGHPAAVPGIPLVVGDAGDRTVVRDLLETRRIEAVIHFAARKSVAESVIDPGGYFETNVGGSLALLQAMADAGVRRLVFSSTCAVYGMPERMPIAEDAPTLPVNVYGRTKLAAENLFSDLARAGEIDVAMLRYFNAAGADGDGEIGEAHDPESHLIPLAIRAALGESDPLALFGTDYPTPDGTCLRDYIHVEDLAEAHIKALRLLETKSGAHAFNLGTGIGVSVREVLGAVGKLAGKTVPVVESPRREGDAPRLYASPAKAERELGWRAAATDIESMVGSAINWHRKARSAA